jgi:uncharacterized low-complexity protein
MKKLNKTPLAVAMGAALISGFAPLAANAEANPFAMTEMSSGYMQLAEAAGEMKCGANMGGMVKPKAAEGACAGSKTTAATEAAKKAEGLCGNMMKDGKMKPGMEKSCGAMMKGKEGACGMAKTAEGTKPTEGKCGAACKEDMKNCEAAKTMEGACGDKMKGCGEGMQGCTEMMKSKDGSCGGKIKPAAPAAAPAAPAPAK